MEVLIGQDRAKVYLEQIVAKAKVDKIRLKNGLEIKKNSLHTALIGPPGTGKTTFARMMAERLKDIGVLSCGHIVEVNRSDLVGRYQGETEIKTEKVIKSALGGILFIDEAYAIYRGENDTFGQHALNLLIKAMEDYREHFMVILAGYSMEMGELYMANSGLKRRISNRIEFEDLSLDQLYEVFNLLCSERGWQIEKKAEELAKEEIRRLHEMESMNGGEVRNLVDRISFQQDYRLSKETKHSKESLLTVIYSDVTEDPTDKGTYEEIACL